jgi:transcriptional regulator with XRE-family HTH domain
LAATSIDSLILGYRLRHFRKQRGLTLEQLGALVDKPAPYLSLLENGKREPRLGLLNELAASLDVSVAELLEPTPPTKRSRMEVALERAQDEPIYRELGLPYLKASARLPDPALEHIVALYEALRETRTVTDPTREAARIANAELRAEMKRRGNYFEEIESVAAEAVEAAGYEGSRALTERDIAQLASHFGFTVERAPDVPPSVRSVTDLRNRRIYVAQRDLLGTRSARSVVIQTLGHFALDHTDPRSFGASRRGELLRRRRAAP